MLTAQPDTAHWIAFNKRPAPQPEFSVLTDRLRRQATLRLVFVEWQCGPYCGHTITVALSALEPGGWRIDQMLLLSSGRLGDATGSKGSCPSCPPPPGPGPPRRER